MSWRSALVSELRNDSTVTGLVGSGNNARIYRRRAISAGDVPLPYIIIERDNQTFTTHQTADTALSDVTTSVRCHAKNDTLCENLADAVRKCLHTKDGTLGTGSHQIDIRGRVILTDMRDDDIEPTDAGQHGICIVDMTFEIKPAITPASP